MNPSKITAHHDFPRGSVDVYYEVETDTLGRAFLTRPSLDGFPDAVVEAVDDGERPPIFHRFTPSEALGLRDALNAALPPGPTEAEPEQQPFGTVVNVHDGGTVTIALGARS